MLFMRYCFVICAVFFDVCANSIDPVNASLYDSFVKKIRKASAKGKCTALGSKRIYRSSVTV